MTKLDKEIIYTFEELPEEKKPEAIDCLKFLLAERDKSSSLLQSV